MPEAAAGRCAPASEEASAGMESTNAFGAKNDEVENCGLRFALFVFGQSFVHYINGHSLVAIYLEFRGRQCRRPSQEVSHERNRHNQRN